MLYFFHLKSYFQGKSLVFSRIGRISTTHLISQDYLHFFEQKSNTGIEIELLQKYIFIPLDLFREKIYAKGIENALDAWLTFLTVDEPEIIIELIERYPEFKPLYEVVYRICQNMEGVMHVFSEELRILDRNTVQLMIDEMQEEINVKREELSTVTEELSTVTEELSTVTEELSTVTEKLSTVTEELNTKTNELNAQKRENAMQKREIEELKKQLA